MFPPVTSGGENQSLVSVSPGPVSYTHLDVYKRQIIVTEPNCNDIIVDTGFKKIHKKIIGNISLLFIVEDFDTNNANKPICRNINRYLIVP